ncbi:WhiB family transcriptional regulator [Mycobacterium sp. 3-98]|uniref:WhiB family transcriptional regulator n=1 Tax=Mycobacterium sp. 3-98 TaxID=3042317 RepID=UPI003FA3D26C
MSAEAFLSAISSPSLPDALCVGRHELFDTAANRDGPERSEAVAICHRCPVLAWCKAWSTAQDWPAGTVVGGQIIAKKSKPKSMAVVKAAAPAELTLEEIAERLHEQWRDRIQARRVTTSRTQAGICI